MIPGTNVTLKALLEVFSSIESANNKMLETDLNLGRGVGICRGVDKMLDLHHVM